MNEQPKNLFFIYDYKEYEKIPFRGWEEIVAENYQKNGMLVLKNSPYPSGIPDLSIYNENGILQFMVEVKAPLDNLSHVQIDFITKNPNLIVFLYKFMNHGHGYVDKSKIWRIREKLDPSDITELKSVQNIPITQQPNIYFKSRPSSFPKVKAELVE